MDYIGASEVFDDVKYWGVDDCDWAIKKTDAYKNFEPKLPKTIKYDVGTYMLQGKHQNLVVCFFNSLFTISNNSNLEKELLEALQHQDSFYLICDYTINSDYHMPKEEQDFIDKLINKLKPAFKFKKFDILDGKGIIVYGVR